MKLHATIFGSSAPKDGSKEYILAHQLGELLTRNGFRVKNGGYYGTMEASARGALGAGQKALGFPFAGFDPKTPNSYIEIKKKLTLFERIESLIHGSDLIVTLPGGLGTLSEIAMTWVMLQTKLLQPVPIVCCIGLKWKIFMETVMNTFEVTPADVELLEFYETLDHFQDKIDNIIERIKKRDDA